MFQIAFKPLASIRAKLILVLCFIGLLLAGIASYAINNIEKTGDLALSTYQGASQTNQYLDDAKINLARMETAIFQQTMAQQNDAPLNLKPVRSQLAALKADMYKLERSVGNQKALFHTTQIQKHIDIWQTQVSNYRPDTGGPLTSYFKNDFQSIYEHLRALSDLQTQAIRGERITVQNNISDSITNITWFVLIAMALAILLTIWMGVTILNPLKLSTDVAKKISGGDFNTDIPQGHKDEMGQLFSSMSVMQNNIRMLLARTRDEKDQAKDNLEAALKNSQDAILITNAAGQIMVANEQVTSFFTSLIDEDFIGGKLSRYFDIEGHPVSGASPVCSGTNEMRLESGRWTKVSASEMEDGGRLLIWSDITQLKQREANLEIAKDKAQSADKAKTLFLASMSHELRTPLNAIIGFSDLMSQELADPDSNPTHRELNQHVLESGEDLLGLIEDIFVVAGTRKETRETLDCAAISLTDIIDNALETISKECAQRNISVIWNKPDTSYNIECNETGLSRVFEAILSNATRFNKDGGRIKVALTPAPKSYHEDGVFIDITDTGIGIAEADLSKIMAPFVQVDGSYNRAHDGAGLGLALAKHWSELHDGKIMVASKLDKGTLVRIFLPVMAPVIAENTVQGDAPLSLDPSSSHDNLAELNPHEKAAQMGEQNQRADEEMAKTA